MKSDVETLGPTRVRLRIEVPFDELGPSIQHAYHHVAQQVRVPGFRPGKAPARLIDQRVGRGYVLEHAVQDALPHFYGAAVREAGVQVVGQPQVSVVDFADGSPLVFTAEVDVRPEFELPPYEGLEVTVDDADPANDEVDEQLEAMRDRFATLTGVERAAQTGDFATIDLSATVNGEAVEDASATGLSYGIGSATLLPQLDELMPGMSVDESRTFTTTLPGGALAGRDAEFTVTVRAVREKRLPELDDDFAQTASEFDTLDELRADIRERLARVKRFQQGLQARERIVDMLLDALDIPLPDSVVADEANFRRQSMDRQLTAAGLTLDAYLAAEGRSQEELDREFDESARKAVTTQFLLDAIARKEALDVSQAEMAEHLVRRARTAGIDPNEYAERVAQTGQLAALVGEALRGKALAVVLEGAQVKDASGRPVDLSAATGTAEPQREESATEGADDIAVEPAGQVATVSEG